LSGIDFDLPELFARIGQVKIGNFLANNQYIDFTNGCLTPESSAGKNFLQIRYANTDKSSQKCS
jgi:hypothetical protein